VWLLYDPQIPPVTWEVPSLEQCQAQADLWNQAALQWLDRVERQSGQKLTRTIVSRCDPVGQEI
jgi:hypothetical protein